MARMTKKIVQMSLDPPPLCEGLGLGTRLKSTLFLRGNLHKALNKMYNVVTLKISSLFVKINILACILTFSTFILARQKAANADAVWYHNCLPHPLVPH